MGRRSNSAAAAFGAAGFAVVLRVFSAGMMGAPEAGNAWWSTLVAITVVTMTLGNVLAIFQSNIKRMLAYSSIAQAGYMLLPFALVSSDGKNTGVQLFGFSVP